MNFPIRFAVAALFLAGTQTSARADDLFDALKKDDADAVARLLKADPRLAAAAGPDGALPIHRAVFHCAPKIITLLIDAGADVNAFDMNGFAPLHLAAYSSRKDQKAVVEALLAGRAKVNLPNRLAGLTPLAYAARYGKKEIVALLLEKGALIDGGIDPKSSEPPWTPLYEAASQGEVRTAEFLLRKGANPNARSGLHGTPLDKAAENRDREMVRLLLANGADVHSDRAFVEAVRAGDREIVNLFLQRGIDVKKPEYLFAAAHTSKEMTEFLLDHGASAKNLDANRQSPLSAAAMVNNDATVALLLGRGADATVADNEGRTPLHSARGVTVAELLIANGADVNAVAKDGTTPLHAALNGGNKALAEALVKRDAKVDALGMAALGRADDLRKYLKDNPVPRPKNMYSYSAIHLAALFGQNDTLAVLLDKGEDIESKTWDKRTPLHVAAERGHKGTVEFLLKKGAELNAKTSADTFGPREQTPLNLALAAGRVEVVRFLVEKGAAPKLGGEFEKQCITHAAQMKDLAMLRYFHERGLALDAEVGHTMPTTVVHLAAEVGDVDALKAFAARGADLKKKTAAGDTTLRAAVRGHQKAAVEYLLKNGADVADSVPLRFAVFQGDKEIVELLLDKGADIQRMDDVFGASFLRTAVQGDQLEVLKFLIARGADVKKDPVILHEAAVRGRKVFVEKLLDAGADVDLEPSVQPGMGTGFFLYYGAFQKRPDVLEFFVEPKDPRPPEGTWNSLKQGRPLHAAVASRQKDVVELLLAKGAKADAKFPNGSTPLHLAAYLGDEETAKLLLANKADVNATDAAGLTPLQVAENEGRKEMAALLRKHGAKDKQ
jgi:ankyrin repeat protein